MKKIMAKLLAACLALSLLPVSAFAYEIPEYAVELKASEERIYEGDTVDISFNISSDDFLMTDMSVGYETGYFTYEGDTSGVVGFYSPELKGADGAGADGEGGYNLATKFTFTAKEVNDTEKVDFSVDAADIVYSYESAKDNAETNVANRTGTSVIIVKQWDVTFEDNGTPLSEQTIDKGLDENNEQDTALVVPEVSYDAYVGEGLDAAHYEHVWIYNGTEYTDEEIEAFGQTGSANEITEDTTFVLKVREKTFDVTVPAEGFNTDETPNTATYGTDYTGKINPDAYDDKYDYTVKYEIDTDGDGVADDTKEVKCVEDGFTIPGTNITGDMTLSYEKKLNIVIEAHEGYTTTSFLITVNGAAVGYTFNGNDMFKSENHANLRAWVYIPSTTGLSEDEVEAEVEDMIATCETSSPAAKAGYDINDSGNTDMNDAALAHGAYTEKYDFTSEWVEIYLSSDVDKSYHVDTDDYNEVVDEYKGRNN